MPIEILLEFPKEKVHQKGIIGEGTFGKVAKAEAWGLAGIEGPTIVALKTLKDNATGEDRKRLLDELGLLKNIGRHKHILSLVGCCTKTDDVYMLFDYMELGNLQQYLRKSRECIATDYLEAGETSPVLTSGDLIIFAGQVASAMEYLSSKKCVHGDLAARNVMVNGGRICKVTNFGRGSRVHNNAKEVSDQKLHTLIE
ncbi:tyrosine kinase receptor Cad96Ca-like [Ptychodera flava]|uniref:tyrosine kinase receptor Cad96Ca-like n=1 Tax=Ptychodera flava TaxID=63121 RepID=UPI00396A528E